MKCSTLLVLFAWAALLLSGCADDTLTSSELSSAEGLAVDQTTALSKAGASTSAVYTFAGMEEVGTSQLLRTDDGVSFKLQTTELVPGTVVTLWMVIFNNPEDCTAPCDMDDLANPHAMADVVYASGRVIGGSGKANYAGHRSEGDNSGSIFPDWLGLPSPGLIDARKAEIHFIVHSHGPKIPGLTSEMLHSFNAGCGPIFDPAFPEVPEELGTYGPNTCVDVQFAVHIP